MYRECHHASPDNTTGGHATGCCYDLGYKTRSHDSSRIFWAKLIARVAEEFPLDCPRCGGDLMLQYAAGPEPASLLLAGLTARRSVR